MPVPDGRTLWIAWCGLGTADGATYLLLVHDPKDGAVTATPPRLDGRLTAAAAGGTGGGSAARPFAVFDDLDGDGGPELAVPEVVAGDAPGDRRVVARWFRIAPGGDLVPFLRLETARPWPFFREGPGTLVRRVEPGGEGRLRVVVRFIPDADPAAARELGTVTLAPGPAGTWEPVDRDPFDPAYEDLLWEDAKR